MLAPNASFEPEEQWDFSEPPEQQAISAQEMLKGALYAGLAAFLVFLFVPGLDTTVTSYFYHGDTHFVWGGSFLQFGRACFNIFFYLTCAATVVGLVIAGRSSEPWLGLRFNKWLFLTLCLIVGPLVVTNIGLKDHWGRARPRDVVEFGGSKAFTPPFPPSTQCAYNCSFVSGEASSIYIVFFAGAFLFKRNSRNMIKLGIILGSLAGLIRIAQGGHFLSDVVFAGIFMALTAACLQLIFDAIKAAELVEIANRSGA